MAVLVQPTHGEASEGAGAPGPKWVALGLGACAVVIEAGLLAVLRLQRPADHVPEFITHYLLIAVAYLVACWLVANFASSLSSRASVRWIWVAGLLFRLTVLPLDPSLSEDTARYRWQGKAQLAGADPYLAVPEETRWLPLRDATWSRVTGKDKPSAYGPLIEQINLQYYRLIQRFESDPWRQVWLFKLPFAAADLAAAVALVALLGALGRSRHLLLVYLWSPLAVTEFWIEGHNDAYPIAFAVAALALSVRGMPVRALIFATFAALCKFWPLVLFPFLMLARRDGRWRLEWRGLLACGPVALILCLPYWDGIAAVPAVLDGFVGGWRNNDSLFAGLLWLADGDMVQAARAAIALLALAVLALRLAKLPPIGAELGAVCALLLLSANCLPWYLTWILPLLAVHPIAPLLLWNALAILAYHVVPMYEAAGVWKYDATLIRLEYGPVLAWLGWLATVALRRRTRPDGRGEAGV